MLATYIPKYKSGYLFPALLKQFDINVPTVMIRKSSLAKRHLRFDEKIYASEEYCLSMQLAVENEFCVIRYPLAKYRIHNRALSNKSISKWAKEREYTLDLIRKNHPAIEKKWKSAFKEAYARARYYRARYYVLNGEKMKAIKELKMNIFINIRYLLLLIVLLLSRNGWNFIHRLKNRRDF